MKRQAAMDESHKDKAPAGLVFGFCAALLSPLKQLEAALPVVRRFERPCLNTPWFI